MSIELILGPMFAGKSSAIMTLVKKYNAIRYKVFVVTSSLDNRYANNNEIINHDFQRMKATQIDKLLPLLDSQEYKESKVIIIEEAQFFNDLYTFVTKSADYYKKHVIVVGLDGDSDRNPFGQILQLVPHSDKIQKITSFCTLCADGTPALFTFCTSAKKEQIQIGATDKYIPLCRTHYLENSGVL